MRIRKHAKLLTPSSSSSSFLVCQLNRSPWDVDSFSLLDGWEDEFSVNESCLAEPIPSQDSKESMELSYEYVERSHLPPPPPPPPPENIGVNNEHIDHYLKPPPLIVVPPLPPVAPPPKKRGRPRKHTTTTTQSATTTTVDSRNPYEFYYYSGFGPRWGKKRGGKKYVGGIGNDKNNCYNTSSNDVGESPSSCSTMSEEDVVNDNKNNNCTITSNVESLVNEELYIEDDFDDDDDDDEDQFYGRKRVRKPVKARSLKSLM